MTKDQWLASAEGQAFQNLFIAILHLIIDENDYKADFAARKQFLEQQRFEAEQRFQARQQFLEEQRFQDQKRFQAGRDFESESLYRSRT